MRIKIKAKQVAELTGDKTYRGGKCRKCGKMIRYTINSACVGCTKTKSMKRFHDDKALCDAL